MPTDDHAGCVVVSVEDEIASPVGNEELLGSVSTAGFGGRNLRLVLALAVEDEGGLAGVERELIQPVSTIRSDFADLDGDGSLSLVDVGEDHRLMTVTRHLDATRLREPVVGGLHRGTAG